MKIRMRELPPRRMPPKMVTDEVPKASVTILSMATPSRPLG